MTRFLSASLQAHEPFFSVGLRRLELAHGNPSADIRLTTQVNHATRIKLQQLGLDPSDTTAHELYLALNERLKADDARLIKNLRTTAATHISAEAEVVAGMAHALQNLPVSRSCYALKAGSLKSLIKKQPPKKAMKQLGYRSLVSMLKHEPLAAILAAAKLCELPSWQRNLVERYKKLKPSDFETRQIAIVHPNTKRWQQFSHSTVATKRHNLLVFPEIGAIVLLPLPSNPPAGAVTASLVLALHAMNEVRASSTFLKLCQVRPDFGTVVQTVATSELKLQTSVLDKSVPWQLVQRYYARMQHLFRDELFEPHIRLEDMSWHDAEQALSLIEPTMDFWQGSHHLGILHNHRAVSLNIVDAALNVCNVVPFEKRVIQYFQQSLWQELLLRYLKHDTVEQTVLAELQPQLSYAPVLAN